MSYNDPKGEAAAINLFGAIKPTSEDENRKAVRHILERAKTAEEAASLLAMLDLYTVAEGMLTERENRLAGDDFGGDAA